MSEREPMSAQDALWLEMARPSNLMVIDSLMWTSESIDWDRFDAVAKDRLWDRYRVFRSTAALRSLRPVEDQVGGNIGF